MIEWTTLVAAVLGLAVMWGERRARLRKRPFGMPGNWVTRYRRENIYVRYVYNEYPDILGHTSPIGTATYFVEHGSRSYSSLEDAKEAIRNGSWKRPKGEL